MTRRGRYEAHIEVDGRKVRIVGKTSATFDSAAAARDALKTGAVKVIEPGDNVHAYLMNRNTGRKRPVALPPQKGARR